MMLIKFFLILFTFYFPFFLLILVFINIYLSLKIILFLIRRRIYNTNNGTAATLYLSLYNPSEDFHLHLPLEYKIFNFKITLLKILLYICLFFYLFFNLRYFRLGQEVNIYVLLSKIFSYSWYILLLGLLGALVMISMFALLWNIFYSNFYKELKKVHIYLYQFGGSLDENFPYNPNAYGLDVLPYYRTYFFKSFNSFSSYFFHRIYILINSYPLVSNKNCNTEYLKKNYSIINFYRNLDLPLITYPLYYYLHVRPHNNSKLRKFILFFLNELKEGETTCFKYLPYVLLLLSFTLEVCLYKGIIYYFFYVLAFIFFYKQIFNIIFFFQNVNDLLDEKLCLYYYKINIFLSNPVYCKKNRLTYTIYMNSKECELIYLYIKYGLYSLKAKAEVYNWEWPRSNTIIGKWWLKKKKLFLSSFIIRKISEGINEIKIWILKINKVPPNVD